MEFVKPIDLSMPRKHGPTIVRDEERYGWTILDLSTKTQPIPNAVSAESNDNKPPIARRSCRAPRKHAAQKPPKIEPVDPDNIAGKQSIDKQQRKQRKPPNARKHPTEIASTNIVRNSIRRMRAGDSLTAAMGWSGADYGRTSGSVRALFRRINRTPGELDQLLQKDKDKREYREYFGHI